jgi:PAS domain S-box-containing protein
VENQPIRVLLVDDDQGDFEMIRVMLSKAEHQEFKLEWVSNYEEAMDAFDSAEHDVYFLDYFLEDRTGLDLLKEARERGITAPIIMLTGRGSRTVDMEAMSLGASDYLVKGLIDPDALERAIRHGMERAEGAQALKERDAAVDAAGAAQTSAGATAAQSSARGFSPGTEAVPDTGSLSGDAARFRAVFHATKSGIAIVGLDGKIVDANPAFREFFAPSPRWTEGLSYLDLLDQSDQEPVARELEALTRGEKGRFEAARRFLIHEGHVLWAHTTMALIKNDEGHPDHVLVVLERAQAEAGD